MRSMRRVGMMTAAAAAIVVVLAGCGGGDDGGPGKDKPSKPAASKSAPASSAKQVTVDEALAAYQKAAAAGCTDAPSCQDQMTAKLAAAKDLRVALTAEDRAAYAEPIRLIRRAESLADHYGPEALGSKGGYAAVNQPLQQAVSWLAVNR
ncbi:hypothetical protein ACFV2X_37880 [Streptomyces sp. NPDC059679]|uniref:hypothetical protein n=1 Tax=Streptomyces sp. NPDC059679 TaxID=3346903 RepID=UPI0036BB88E1